MGRRLQYDEETVLELAMNCFWVNGYKNTSIRLLEKEMGINQFSIYSSFKNKDQLYCKVLNMYIEKLKSKYLDALLKEDSDITDVRRFMMEFGSDMLKGKIPSNCLMVSSIISYNQFTNEIRGVIDSFTKLMENLFYKALTNSIKSGLINKNVSLNIESKYLLGITQSISIMNKNVTKKELVNYINNSIDKIG